MAKREIINDANGLPVVLGYIRGEVGYKAVYELRGKEAPPFADLPDAKQEEWAYAAALIVATTRS